MLLSWMIALKQTCLEAFRNANCGQKALGFLNKRCLQPKKATREEWVFLCTVDVALNEVIMEDALRAGNTGEPSGVNTHTERNDCQLPDGRGGDIIVKTWSYCLNINTFQWADRHGSKATHNTLAHTVRWLGVSVCDGLNVQRAPGSFFNSAINIYTLRHVRSS